METTNESLFRHPNTILYKFCNNIKSVLEQGNSEIFIDGLSEYTLLINQNFYQQINRWILIKFQRTNHTLYFFDNALSEDYMLALQLENHNHDFEAVVKKFGKIISIDSDDINPILSQKIILHANCFLKGKQQNKSSAISKDIGNFFGSIGNLIRPPITQIGQTINQTKDKLVRQKISQDTKSKWNKVTDSASKLNDRITQTIKPFTEKIRETVSSVGKSYDESENSAIKGFRQFTQSAKKSFNEGYHSSSNQNDEARQYRKQNQGYKQQKQTRKEKNTDNQKEFRQNTDQQMQLGTEDSTKNEYPQL